VNHHPLVDLHLDSNEDQGTTEHLANLDQMGISSRKCDQSINKFISRHSTEARATVRLCRIKEKCLKTDLKCVLDVVLFFLGPIRFKAVAQKNAKINTGLLFCAAPCIL